MGRRRLGWSPSALSRSVGDEVFVTAPGRTEIDRLGGGAVAVWRMIGSEPTFDELVEQVARLHGVDRIEIEQQVADTVRELIGRGWVRGW